MSKHSFNDYEIIDENTVSIKLKYKDQFLYGLIDLEDLPKLIDLNQRWCANYKEDAHGFYAITNIILNGSKQPIELHRIILDTVNKKGIWVDHINNNGLDNRKSNLRLTTSSNNNRNRKGKNSNNTTGYRNVCYYEGWYIIQIQIDGKNTTLGKFKDIHEAAEFAEKMRLKYYGEFSGKGE